MAQPKIHLVTEPGKTNTCDRCGEALNFDGPTIWSRDPSVFEGFIERCDAATPRPGRFSTTTRLRVTVEVSGSRYGPDWNVGDMAEQCRREGVQHLVRLLEKEGGRVIGEPVVLFTTSSEDGIK